MAVPGVLPRCFIVEVHRDRSMRICIVGMEAASTRLNQLTVDPAMAAAVVYVVMKPIVVGGWLRNAPRSTGLFCLLEEKTCYLRFFSGG